MIAPTPSLEKRMAPADRQSAEGQDSFQQHHDAVLAYLPAGVHGVAVVSTEDSGHEHPPH